MGWPIATFASGINKLGENQFEVTREIDSGLQKVIWSHLVLFAVI